MHAHTHTHTHTHTRTHTRRQADGFTRRDGSDDHGGREAPRSALCRLEAHSKALNLKPQNGEHRCPEVRGEETMEDPRQAETVNFSVLNLFVENWMRSTHTWEAPFSPVSCTQFMIQICSCLPEIPSQTRGKTRFTGSLVVLRDD